MATDGLDDRSAAQDRWHPDCLQQGCIRALHGGKHCGDVPEECAVLHTRTRPESPAAPGRCECGHPSRSHRGSIRGGVARCVVLGCSCLDFKARSAESASSPLEQDVNRAFRLWCAEADFAIDYTAPHWGAFQAGYEHGREDEYHAYLRSAVT